jgi:hypothetical protein
MMTLYITFNFQRIFLQTNKQIYFRIFAGVGWWQWIEKDTRLTTTTTTTVQCSECGFVSEREQDLTTTVQCSPVQRRALALCTMAL